MSNKAECPACKSYLSAVYDAMNGDRDAPCPSCGLPAGVLREVEKIRKFRADAELTAKLEDTLVRAGKAEAEVAKLRDRLYRIGQVFSGWDDWKDTSWEDWSQGT